MGSVEIAGDWDMKPAPILKQLWRKKYFRCMTCSNESLRRIFTASGTRGRP